MPIFEVMPIAAGPRRGDRTLRLHGRPGARGGPRAGAGVQRVRGVPPRDRLEPKVWLASLNQFLPKMSYFRLLI